MLSRNPLNVTTALVFALFSMLLFAPAHLVQAQTETILHNFTCQSTDGCEPYAGVVLDSHGNLYGTTPFGGAYGVGVVYKLTPSGNFTILHSFRNTGDGYFPYAGLALDSSGNLWGTTEEGGTYGAGTVFEVTPSGTEPWLYSFDPATGVSYPGAYAGVVLDSQGNLYGTTYGGGTYGCGTVFKLVPSSFTLTTLYSFTCGADGAQPGAGVVLDSADNLYDTTPYGGASGFGVVFKVTQSGTETVLHSFTPNGEDGVDPQAGVILDSEDNIYGTTVEGGHIGVGTVFEVTASGTETVLHSFKGGKDGISPYGSLVFDKKGNLYGTTFYGGSFDLGTVFELKPSGAEKILHSFAYNGIDGILPWAGLAIDSSGNLYGTTTSGGTGTSCLLPGCGTVFKVVTKAAKDKTD